MVEYLIIYKKKFFLIFIIKRLSCKSYVEPDAIDESEIMKLNNTKN